MTETSRTRLDQIDPDLIGVGTEVVVAEPVSSTEIQTQQPLQLTDRYLSQISEKVKKDAARIVEGLVDSIKDTDIMLSEDIKTEIASIGQQVIVRSSNEDSTLLSAPVRNSMKNAGDKSPVVKDLAQLNRVIAELNPSRKRMVLGMIPMSRKIEDTIRGWQASKPTLEKLQGRLEETLNNILLDQQALSLVKQNSLENIDSLVKYIYSVDVLVKRLDEELETETDPVKRAALEEALTIALKRQKTLMVNARAMEILFQGYVQSFESNKLFAEAIRDTNTTTMNVLRGSIMLKTSGVALANAQQAVDAVNNLAGKMLVDATDAARTNSAKAHKQATSTGISIDDLKKAYDNMALASQEAIEAQKNTITTLRTVLQQLDTQFSNDSNKSVDSGTNTKVYINPTNRWEALEG